MSPPERETVRILTLRFLPFLMAGHLLMNLDRSNISFAALQMNADLGLSAQQFGFAAGIFFWGYLLFEVPSNFALRRFGARFWIGRIMITWGLAAALLAASFDFQSLAAFRFLLGATEAGFTPGILYLMTQWYPQRHRATAMSRYTMMSPVAAVAGGPLAAVLLGVSTPGLQGWQWLFIVEGGVTVVFGVLFILRLPDSPDTASWLPERNRAWLKQELAAESEAQSEAGAHSGFLAVLRSPVLWLFSASYFAISVAIFGLFFWLPQLVAAEFPSLGSSETSLVTAIPYTAGAIALIAVGRTSDRTGDRRWHLVGISAVGALAMAGSALGGNGIVSFLSLCVAVACVFAYVPVFWPNPMAVLTGSAAIGGLAVINSIGTFGGFLGPNILGVLKDFSGSFHTGLASLAVFFVLAALFPLAAPRYFPRNTKNSPDERRPGLPEAPRPAS